MPPAEEDDWETADLSTFAPTSSKPKPDLRPTAPAFQPVQIASGSKPRQRVFAPPGGGGTAGFAVNNTVDQRADWDRRAAAGRREAGPAGPGGGGEEDEWFRAGQRGQTNRQLWDEANTHSPPTNVQIEAPTPLPPPQIKILRRSNQSPSSLGGAGGATGNKASPSPKTYAEKEEEYRLARERIFGKAGTAVAAVGSGSSGTGQETEGGYTSKTASPGSGSRGNSPQPQPVPHQIPSSQFGGMRRSPAGSPASSQHGVLRQPRGPSGGGGFGQAPNPGALPPGW